MAERQYAWSVRGVSREARERAKKAAHRRRVTIGEWVSFALISVAGAELAVDPDTLPPIGAVQDPPEGAAMDARERALVALAIRPDRSEQDQQAPWSIRGVSQIARVKASQAAAHRRATIGDWVDHAILIHGEHETGIARAPVLRPAPVAAPATPDVPEKAMKLVEALARHIDGPHTPDTPVKPSPRQAARNEERISDLAERVRENEDRNEQRLANLTSALTIFANRLKLTGAVTPAATPAQPPAGMPPDVPARPPAEAAPAPPPATAKDRLSEAELAFWEAVKDSTSPEDFEAYLETFPEGLFASLAHARAARAAGYEADERDRPAPRGPRRPPAGSYPRLDFDTLNERAIENTKRTHVKK